MKLKQIRRIILRMFYLRKGSGKKFHMINFRVFFLGKFSSPLSSHEKNLRKLLHLHKIKFKGMRESEYVTAK